MPALGKIELRRAIDDAVRNKRARVLTHFPLSPAADAPILQIKILPVEDGVTLVWYDVTDRARAEQTLKRDGDRLALAAEGANDGLWELDLVRKEFYFSSRWRALLGLSPEVGVGPPEEWFDRVHTDDIAGLKEALEAHLAAKTAHFQHQHRIRRADGTYRLFLCRGVGVRPNGHRATRVAGS